VPLLKVPDEVESEPINNSVVRHEVVPVIVSTK